MGNVLARIAPHTPFSDTFFPPAPTYNPSTDIPDLTGKVVIVTGGNSGIGYETVKHLLLKNAKVYLAARSESKALEAIAELKKETSKEALYLKLDLGDLDSVKQAAEEFLRKEDSLDVLWNNAGVMVPPTNQLTVQGYDLQWGTNVVGHYLFTILLLPALIRSYKTTGNKARVIHTSSAGHKLAEGPSGLLISSTKGSEARDALIKNWGGVAAPWRLYGFSKMGNVMVSNLLQREHSDILMSCAVHPGGLKSPLHRHEPWWQQRFHNFMFHEIYLGAYTQLWAGTSPEGADFGGQYLYPWARMGKADSRASNEQSLVELQNWLDEELKPWL